MNKYETFSTTADVGIRIWGNGYEEFFKNAIKGLNLLYFGDYPTHTVHTENTSHIPFAYHGDSCENILVNLLSEIVFLVQYENKFVTDIIVYEANETFLKSDFIVASLHMEPELEIKSATYHNLKIEEINGIKSAEVIFDV